MTITRPHICILFALLLGCVEETESIDALAARTIRAENDVYGSVCDCWSRLGYDSQPDCLEDNVTTLEQRYCENSVYVSNEAGVRPHLECVADAYVDYLDCAEQRVCTTFDGDEDVCELELEFAWGACPGLPWTVRNALDECWDFSD